MPPKLPSAADNLPVPVELVERRIYLIRGQKVMLDSDLAELYQVTTGNLNLAVRRNAGRFPEDFMFQLTKEETENFEIANCRAQIRPWRPAKPALSLSPSTAWPCCPLYSTATGPCR